MNKKNGFTVWDSDLEKELFSEEEIAASKVRVSFISTIINARKELGLSQRELEELTGLKQSAIARIESGTSNPTLDTLIKALVPMGKTLSIVPIEDNKKVKSIKVIKLAKVSKPGKKVYDLVPAKA